MFQTRRRHLARVKEILEVLAKHGLSQLFSQFGLEDWFIKWKGKEVNSHLSPPERLRLALEDLGPTFVKLGQLLGTRPDILPMEYISELEKLQDQVNPVPFKLIASEIEAELGMRLNQVFAHLDEAPLASASIGQVHVGKLLDGTQIVVKVQRPRVSEVIETDLAILFDLARVIEENTKWGVFYRVVDLTEEFSQAIREEVDYTIEGRNADRFRKMFLDSEEVKIPKVYWEFTSVRVLVLEYIDGVKISNLDMLEVKGYDRDKIARRLANTIFRQIYIHGFFHADPHPGNVAVMKDEVIALMDFGMVGRVGDELKSQFVNLVLAIVRQDTKAMVELLLDIGKAHGKVNRGNLQKDLERLMHQYLDRPLSQVALGDIVGKMLSMANEYKIRVPVEIILLGKCLVTLEGLVRRLSPNISIIDLAEPFGKELVKERFSPKRIKKFLLNQVVDLGYSILSLPKRVDNLISQLEEGELRVKLEHQNLQHIVRRLNIIGNRLSFSIVIAAIIIGSSLIARVAPSKLLTSLPIAEVGFIVALLMGLWWLYSILRSGRI